MKTPYRPGPADLSSSRTRLPRFCARGIASFSFRNSSISISFMNRSVLH